MPGQLASATITFVTARPSSRIGVWRRASVRPGSAGSFGYSSSAGSMSTMGVIIPSGSFEPPNVLDTAPRSLPST